ncbi:PRD domain-containing protein [Collinsella provencensis]|uniref:PRD domain-containing protein n=1 Tax=Collinsella provencensis TaxID=1937461 RepID=UPI000C815F0B|nr:PRD domain-containing protein [Collinsella provencensis]
MKVIKNINNNVSLCLDSAGTEVVAFGKGIGFRTPPYEIDVSQIDKTFYGVKEAYATMITDVPMELVEAADDIVRFARNLIGDGFNPHITFTLADHINFAVERCIKGIEFLLPIDQDVRFMLEHELKVGQYGVELINKRFGVTLPKGEEVYIALHIANAELEHGTIDNGDEAIIARIVEIVERDFDTKIDQDSVGYSRFVSHMRYLFRRCRDGESMASGNADLFGQLAVAYPDVHRCCEHIRTYLDRALGFRLTDEECVYLILHINRLRAGEGR